MKTSLFDIIDTSTYSREQLVQLLEMFYNLLQERAVNVQLQPAPMPFTVPNIPYNPSPYNPSPYVPPFGTVYCNSGDATNVSPV